MARKKWTPKEEITESVLKFREKRKWQIALRRYVLERNPCANYAPFFGLDADNMRNWIALQFKDGLNWDNFSSHWQFEHVVPVVYFDLAEEEDRVLCWNFTNIRVQDLSSEEYNTFLFNPNPAIEYFKTLYSQTGLPICQKMLAKIDALQHFDTNAVQPLSIFINNHKEYIQTLAGLSVYEFGQLNAGVPIEEIMAEKKILERFGG